MKSNNRIANKFKVSDMTVDRRARDSFEFHSRGHLIWESGGRIRISLIQTNFIGFCCLPIRALRALIDCRLNLYLCVPQAPVDSICWSLFSASPELNSPAFSSAAQQWWRAAGIFPLQLHDGRCLPLPLKAVTL